MHFYSRRPKAFSVIVKSSRRIVASSIDNGACKASALRMGLMKISQASHDTDARPGIWN